MKTKLMLMLMGLMAVSCMEKRSDNPEEVFRLWSNEKPPKEIKLVHSKYWQSAHFTKEYEMYLELIAPEGWRRDFVKTNNLVVTDSASFLPGDAPNWFKPSREFKTWCKSQVESSRYYEDTVSGRMFIYEIQL